MAQPSGPTGERPDGASRFTGERPDGASRFTGERPDGASRFTGERPDGASRFTGERPDGASRFTGERPDGASRFTGERPDGASMPRSLQMLHDAGYESIAARLGDGVLVDVGSGVGDGSAALCAEGRQVIGIDYDIASAAESVRRYQADGLEACCMDATSLGLREASADFVCSSHLIEHFVDPSGHVAELARVLSDEGTCFVVTPNEPADFENPFHLTLFRPESLDAMLSRYFEDVWVGGLDGSARVKDEFARRRRWANRLLKVDFLGLRHRLPRKYYVGLHGLARRLAYPLINRRQAKAVVTDPVTTADFHVTETIDDTTMVLFATARRPRRA